MKQYKLEIGPFLGEGGYLFKEHELNFDIPFK